jgi:hypothetical protein
MLQKVNLDIFNELFESELVHLPDNMLALGFINEEIYYYTNGEHTRIPIIIEFWQRFIHRRLDREVKYYVVICYNDGYRERIPYNEKLIWKESTLMEWLNKGEINCQDEMPILHRKKYIVAFCKHINDESCICIPDIYYMEQYSYHELKYRVDKYYYNWRDKKNVGVYRGKIENGSPSNFIKAGDKKKNHREYFEELYHKNNWESIINYGRDLMSIEEQLKYKYIIDIDGYTNSWEGLVWKLYSGSVVLKHQSIWKQWYYDELEEYVHYIPIENDFSDLEKKVKWCMENDEKCKEIASESRKFICNKLGFEYVIEKTIKNIQEII